MVEHIPLFPKDETWMGFVDTRPSRSSFKVVFAQEKRVNSCLSLHCRSDVTAQLPHIPITVNKAGKDVLKIGTLIETELEHGRMCIATSEDATFKVFA